MPTDRTRALLLDALEAIDHINETVRNQTVEDYLASRDMRAIVERNFIMIGEVLARIRDTDEAAVRQITAYPRAIGLRNLIIHDYRRLSDEDVWTTSQESLPQLRSELNALLEGEPA